MTAANLFGLTHAAHLAAANVVGALFEARRYGLASLALANLNWLKLTPTAAADS